MLRSLLLLSFAAAVCLSDPGSKWITPVNWPPVGGKVGMLNNSDQTGLVPNFQDRGAFFWYSLWSSSVLAFRNDHLPVVKDDDCIPDIGSSSGSPTPDQVSWNTIRLARAHALDRWNCTGGKWGTTSSPVSSDSTSAWTAQSQDCDGLVPPTNVPNGRYTQYSPDGTGTWPSYEFSVARTGLASTLHPIWYPKMAIYDLLCEGTWDSATSSWAGCAAWSRTYFSTAGQEFACSVIVDAQDSLGKTNGYSVSCVVINKISTPVYESTEAGSAPNYYHDTGRYKKILSGVHTGLQDGNVIFGVVIDGTTYATIKSLTVEFSDSADTRISGTQVMQQFEGGSAYNYYYNSLMTPSEFSTCVAYRFKIVSFYSGANRTYYYPGSLNVSAGWLKTSGLGTCTQDYCQCLTADATNGACCVDNCYIAPTTTVCTAETPCNNAAYCNGVNTVCPSVTQKTEGTLCGTPTSHPYDPICNPNMTCTGIPSWGCHEQPAADNTPCGNQTQTGCHNPDYCVSAACYSNYIAAGQSCNTSAPGNLCQGITGSLSSLSCWPVDTCDGSGNLVSHKKSSGDCSSYATSTTIPSDSDVECFTATCNSSGVCDVVFNTGTCAVCTPGTCCSDHYCSSATYKCNRTSNLTDYSSCGSSGTPGNPCDPGQYCLSGTCTTNDTETDHCSSTVDSCGQWSTCQSRVCVTPKCSNCPTLKTSTLCNANYVNEHNNPLCMWCGESDFAYGGCQNRTAADGTVLSKCVIDVCGGTTIPDSALKPFITSNVTCPSPVSGLYSPLYKYYPSSYEVVKKYTLDRQVLSAVCILFDIQYDLNLTGISDTGIATVPTGDIDFTVVAYTDTAGLPSASWTYSVTRQLQFGERGAFLMNATVNFGETGITSAWGLDDVVYVGVRWEQQCPQIWVVPHNASTAQACDGVSYSRNPANSTEPWSPHGAVGTDCSGNSLEALFDYGKCHDGYRSASEICDNENDPYCYECNCHFEQGAGGYHDNDTELCKCAGLAKIDPQGFVSPPFLNLTGSAPFFNEDTRTISLAVVLPQTIPERLNATAQIVRARTGDMVAMMNWTARTIPLTPYPCRWYGNGSWSVDDLIKYSEPMMVEEDEDKFTLVFAVMVSWQENVTLSPNVVDTDHPDFPQFWNLRNVSARLGFSLSVIRQVTTFTNVTVIDSTLLWAYISRGYLVTFPNSRPYFDISIETRPKYTNLSLDTEYGFRWESGVPGITGTKISEVTNGTITPHSADFRQTVNFRIYFQEENLCDLLVNNERFTMSYRLMADDVLWGVSTSLQYMNLTIPLTENFCSFNMTADTTILGRQQTYPNTNLLASDEDEVVVISNRFIRGARILVVVDLPFAESSVLQSQGYLVDMVVTRVDLDGAALRNGYVNAYSNQTTACMKGLTTGALCSPAVQNSAWAVEPISCSLPKKARGCYTILLQNNQLKDELPLTIQTELELVFTEPNTTWTKKRFATPELKSNKLNSRSRIMIGAPTETGTLEQKPHNEVAPNVVVYRVTPAFIAAVASLAFISVFSIVSTIWFVRRRESNVSL